MSLHDPARFSDGGSGVLEDDDRYLSRDDFLASQNSMEVRNAWGSMMNVVGSIDLLGRLRRQGLPFCFMSKKKPVRFANGATYKRADRNNRRKCETTAHHTRNKPPNTRGNSNGNTNRAGGRGNNNHHHREQTKQGVVMLSHYAKAPAGSVGFRTCVSKDPRVIRSHQIRKTNEGVRMRLDFNTSSADTSLHGGNANGVRGNCCAKTNDFIRNAKTRAVCSIRSCKFFVRNVVVPFIIRILFSPLEICKFFYLALNSLSIGITIGIIATAVVVATFEGDGEFFTWDPEPDDDAISAHTPIPTIPGGTDQHASGGGASQTTIPVNPNHQQCKANSELAACKSRDQRAKEEADLAEAIRVKAEAERVKAEAERAKAEQVKAEAGRVEAEAGRVKAEAERAKAEQKAAEFDERIKMLEMKFNAKQQQAVPIHEQHATALKIDSDNKLQGMNDRLEKIEVKVLGLQTAEEIKKSEVAKAAREAIASAQEIHSQEIDAEMERRIKLLEDQLTNKISASDKELTDRLAKVEEILNAMVLAQNNKEVDPKMAIEINKLVSEFATIKEERSMDHNALKALEMKVQDADAKQKELESEFRTTTTRIDKDLSSLKNHAKLMDQLKKRLDKMDDLFVKLQTEYAEAKTATQKIERSEAKLTRAAKEERAHIAQAFEESKKMMVKEIQQLTQKVIDIKTAQADYERAAKAAREAIVRGDVGVMTIGDLLDEEMEFAKADEVTFLADRLRDTEKEIRKLMQDKTGLTDWIDEVLASSSTFYQSPVDHLYGFFGFELPYSPPEETTQAVSRAGDCWAMRGNNGWIRYALIRPITLDAISIEHIHKDITHNQGSTPRDIEIKARAQDGKWLDLGSYKYKISGNPIQFFNISIENGQTGTPAPTEVTKEVQDLYFTEIHLDVKSNYGNQEFTCLYRVRVHGKHK